jgi:S-(hydroxymethyl)glutathione dehydrogenase / alcohol dehydrogenase
MKAAVLHAPHQPITVEQVRIAKPKRREVLIRTAFAGVCHSDLHFIDGLLAFPMPCVLGHEASGIVEAAGEDVTYVRPGDHVVTCLSVFCGECPQCLTGHPSLCENTEVKLMPGVARRLAWNGKVLHQLWNLSAFAEQMLVHERAVVKIDRDMALDRAALIGCGVLTGVGAVTNAAKVEPGSVVAVIGCGGVGLSAVNGALLAGAGQIIAVDTMASKLTLASRFGATHTVDALAVDPVEAVQAMTGGKGVHHAFEAIGLKKTVEQAFAMLRPGGMATVIGAVPPGVKIEVSGADLLRDRKIQGTSMGSNRFRVDIPRLIEFYRQGRLHLDHLITAHVGLGDLNESFAELKAGRQVRQVIDFGAI